MQAHKDVITTYIIIPGKTFEITSMLTPPPGCNPAGACIKGRVGQNHLYTVYIRYFWQGNHQIYGNIRCIYTVLANPN
jgi:hypothetical protein